MDKRIISCLLATGLLGSTGMAHASDWYIKGGFGVAATELDSGGLNTAGPHENTGDDTDSGFGFLSGAVGRKFGNVRVEAELTTRATNNFTTNSFEPPTPTFFYESEVRAHSLMLNGWWDFARSGKWTPFVGLGIGAARVKVETDDTVVRGSDSETHFAYQVGLGASYDLGNDSAVELGYRYVDLGKVDVNLVNGALAPAGELKTDIDSHDLYIAWRMHF